MAGTSSQGALSEPDVGQETATVHAEIDAGAFRHLAYRLQPRWIRLASALVPAAVLGLMYFQTRNMIAAILAALIAVLLVRVSRQMMTEREVRGWRGRSLGGSERYAIGSHGFRVHQQLFPWSAVTDAAEIEHQKAGYTLLAVRAAGEWRIWPSHGFVAGSFRQTRELVEQKLNEKPRSVAL